MKYRILSVILIMGLFASVVSCAPEKNTSLIETEVEVVEEVLEEEEIETEVETEEEVVEEVEETEEETEEILAEVEETTSSTSTTTAATGTTSYYIKVNIKTQVVTIYSKDSEGYYTSPVKAFICSTGSATPTSGVYTSTDKYRWHTLFYNVYGQYCMRITGSILFHSVPYYTYGDPGSLETEEYDKLGTAASAGCVRLTVAGAKWIYDNCVSGTKVEFISESSDPISPASVMKISSAKGDLKNWDPTDTDSSNPWIDYFEELEEEESSSSSKTESSSSSKTESSSSSKTESSSSSKTEETSGETTENTEEETVEPTEEPTEEPTDDTTEDTTEEPSDESMGNGTEETID